MTSRRPPRLLLLAATVLAGVLPLAACGGGGSSPSSAQPGAVQVNDNYFTPGTIEIHTGDTVTWTWTGAADHNVTGPGFNSVTQGKGTTYQHTFTTAGTINYVCTIHSGMKGVIKVSG